MSWSLAFQENYSSSFQWVVFAESLQDRIRADVNFKNLISTALLYTVCIFRHVLTIASNQGITAALVSVYQLTHTNAPYSYLLCSFWANIHSLRPPAWWFKQT